MRAVDRNLRKGKDGEGRDWEGFLALLVQFRCGCAVGWVTAGLHCAEGREPHQRNVTRGRGNLPRVDEEGITQVEVIEGIPDMTVYDSMPLLFRASFDLEIR